MKCVNLPMSELMVTNVKLCVHKIEIGFEKITSNQNRLRINTVLHLDYIDCISLNCNVRITGRNRKLD